MADVLIISSHRELHAIPGALGLDQATASTLSSAFYALTFLASMPFAILSDAWLGRYKAICISFFVDLSMLPPDIR
jgi:POT family proton-dependent oligopeptide transporter